MHSSYRGSSEWKELGLPMSTGSEEACKLFDAALTQIHSWRDDDSLGGLDGTLEKMKQADPDFLMGYVLRNYMVASSGGREVDGKDILADDLARMNHLANTLPNVSAREKKHVAAVNLWAEGEIDLASLEYEDILLEHPYDTCAISMAFNTYFMTGKSFQIRDCLARVLPHWKPSTPLYSYMLGLHAFGLQESNMCQQAEVVAQKALSMNPCDAWSTHTMCHILETTGRPQKVLDMMESTQDNWLYGSGLACHNYWHWALDNIELGNYETALSILDSQLTSRLNSSGSLFNLMDATSLLYRLQFEDVPVEDRWYQLSDVYKAHTKDHGWAFGDIHVFFGCLNSKEEGLADEMMASIEEFVREGKGTTRDVTAEVGEAIMMAFSAYKEGNYGEAVDLMYPIRYRIREIGGSNSQRDLFNLFLIQAAIRSSSAHHHRLARNLLNERKAIFPDSPMTDRMMAKVLEIHAD